MDQFCNWLLLSDVDCMNPRGIVGQRGDIVPLRQRLYRCTHCGRPERRFGPAEPRKIICRAAEVSQQAGQYLKRVENLEPVIDPGRKEQWTNQ
jgi:hypothetical protein